MHNEEVMHQSAIAAFTCRSLSNPARRVAGEEEDG